MPRGYTDWVEGLDYNIEDLKEEVDIMRGEVQALRKDLERILALVLFMAGIIGVLLYFGI